MTIPLLDLGAQYRSCKKEIDAAIQGVLDSSQFIGGPALARFEEDFARACGTSRCLGVGSGTDALALILEALGVGPGDEVITVPNTFAGTTEPIRMVGASVRFIDVNPGTLLMDSEGLDAAIGAQTKAILPVHLYGQMADMDSILGVAGRRGIPVVEDAAQAHLASRGGRRAGSIGVAGAFSFYPGKNLGAYGDGGAVVTSDEDLADRVAMLSDHGRTEKYIHQIQGRNSRLDSLQAAILGAKLPFLEDWNRRRRRLADLYRSALSDRKGQVELVEEDEGSPVYHQFVIRVRDRDRVRESLASRGVMTGIHYPIPLHLQPAYRYLGHKEGDFPVSEQAAREVLSLPMDPEMTDASAARVLQALDEALRASVS